MPDIKLILGGTFNPPHYGHTLPALAIAKQLGASRLGLMPCRHPPHKEADGTMTKHRIEMVRLMCSGDALLYPELIELSLPTPSFTIQTLKALRKNNPSQTLIFLLGQDSLYNLEDWFQWQDILSYCHIVVMSRADNAVDWQRLSGELVKWLNRHQVPDPECLKMCQQGYVWLAPTPLYPISSGQLRHWLQRSDETCYEKARQWLPSAVLAYIRKHQLY